MGDKKVKEIVPFFMDFLKKTSHLRPVNGIGKEFLEGLCPENNTYRCFDMKEMKKMSWKRRKNSLVIKKSIERPQWKEIERDLGHLENNIEVGLKSKRDILKVLQAVSGNKGTISISTSAIDDSRKIFREDK